MMRDVFAAVLVLAGLLLPGAGLAFAFRWPAPWLVAGVISSLVIFTGVVGFSIIGVPITISSLGIWLAGVTVAGAWLWRSRRGVPRRAKQALGEWWLALPAVPMLVVAALRVTLHPLPGADNVFRWDHLAQLIVQLGHLDYYPPHTPEGFSLYFWADGIPPAVSSLYAWTYLAAGSRQIGWTAIPVLLQVSGLLLLLHSLGQLWGGLRGGWFAIALGGATMLLQFSFCLGQETGLTALGVGGMVLYLMHWQRERVDHLLIPAAACAALAACAREYGGAFVLVGVVWVYFFRRGWKSWLGFSGAAALLPVAWHLRNWYLTGNPLYAQDVAGVFPLNPVFHAWMQNYVVNFGKILADLAGWREISRLLLMSAVPALFGFTCGIALWMRERGAMGWIVIGILTVALWLASVPFTAGGFFYSMRVMSPLMVLGCAWGGGALARWFPGRHHLTGLLAGLFLFGSDAALRAWTIPINPYSIPPKEWSDAGYRIQLDFARDDQAFMDELARFVPGKVLSDSAGLQSIFRVQGKKLVPFWSPDVAFLSSPSYSGDAVSRLRELGYSHVLLNRADSSMSFLASSGILRRFDGRVHVDRVNQTYILFGLDAKVPIEGKR